MLTSGQVKARYGISKSRLDVLAARFKNVWKLKKDSGKFLWNDEAITLLLAYLGKEATDPITEAAPTLPTLPILSAPTAPTADNAKIILDFARAIGEKLESVKKEIQADFKNELANQAEKYQGKISELKQELASIKKSLPPEHGERRHPPEGFFDLLYRYFCLTPAVERRR